MDKEMIEQCCLAACEALGSKYTKDDKYGDYTVVEDRTICITDAIKAIIFAMREPTEKMSIAGTDEWPNHYRVWTAMIDSILND